MYRAVAVGAFALVAGCGGNALSEATQEELGGGGQQIRVTPTGDERVAELVVRAPPGQAVTDRQARLLVNGRTYALGALLSFPPGKEKVLLSLHTPGFHSFGVTSKQTLVLKLGFRTEIDLASLKTLCDEEPTTVTVGGKPTLQLKGAGGVEYEDATWCGNERILLPADYRLSWMPLDVFGPGELIKVTSGDTLVKDFTAPDRRIQVVITAPRRELPGNTSLGLVASHDFEELSLQPEVATPFTALAGELIFVAGRTYQRVEKAEAGKTYELAAERLDVEDVVVEGQGGTSRTVRGTYTLSFLEERFNRWLPVQLECGVRGEFKDSCPTSTGTDVARGHQYKIVVSYVTTQGPQTFEKTFDFR
jgi:hypothetical protein